MHYVYILRSELEPSQLYYGMTSNLKSRLKSHNNGQSKHTSKFKPWKVIWYGSFESIETAKEFETYLKTASGKAFLRKRLIKY
ncbi:MAG: GIY-YIG nuclease family protein [Patescibacteria group bacterium]